MDQQKSIRDFNSGESPPSRVKVERTEKQRETARKNGAKSRGPRTAEGKAVSRINALQHGVYAMALPPQADARGEDSIFRNIIGELVCDFPPRDFGERNAIQTVAYRIIQQRRLRRAYELMMMPKPRAELHPDVHKRLADRRLVNQVLELNRITYASIDTGKLPGLSEADAELLAKRCFAAVSLANAARTAAARLKGDLPAASEPEAPAEEPDEDDSIEAINALSEVDHDNIDHLCKVAAKRVGRPERTIDSFSVDQDPAYPNAPRAWKDSNGDDDDDEGEGEEVEWGADEFLSYFTIASALNPVAEDFATPKQLQAALQQKHKLEYAHKFAWLELLRFVRCWTHPPDLKPGDPTDIEDPQVLTDSTLRGLLGNLSSVEQLQRLMNAVDRAIERDIRSLRRNR